MSQESLNVERLAGRYSYLERARLLPLPSKDGITIVVELSHPEWAATCLQLLLQHSGAPLQIVAVSMDATFPLSLLSSQFTSEQPIIFVPYEEGYYMTNQALAYMETSFAVLLEDSIMVSPGWLSELMWPALEDNLVMVAAPRSSTERAEGKELLHFGSHHELAAFVSHNLGRCLGDWRVVDVLTGSCLLFTKELLNRIGGFDPSLKARYLKIADWCLRARLLGAELVLSEAVYVHAIHSLEEDSRWMNEEKTAAKTEDWKVYSQKWALEDCEENGPEDEEYLVPEDLSLYSSRPYIPLGKVSLPFPLVTAIVFFEEERDSDALKQQWMVTQEQQSYKDIRWIWVRDKSAGASPGFPVNESDVVITVYGEDAWLRVIKNSSVLYESGITIYLSASAKYDNRYVERIVKAMINGSADLVVSLPASLNETEVHLHSGNWPAVLPLERVAHKGGILPGDILRRESVLQLHPEASLILGYIGEAGR